ncbi:unnamed protein product [Blepharisma stoltei]|uniref:Uncharacterized protein n=1 Tax=Blepharisma stoltei TaxID=1481888 RepID=A0AAU9JMQ0_9CILI|nr:unnamed protein product [Blepharisma stoltei]
MGIRCKVNWDISHKVLTIIPQKKKFCYYEYSQLGTCNKRKFAKANSGEWNDRKYYFAIFFNFINTYKLPYEAIILRK